MLKIHTKKSEIKLNHKIMGILYPKAQYLLQARHPVAYSSIYNKFWQCDYYYVNEVVISMGNSILKNKNMKDTDYSLLEKYEEKARMIWNNSSSYDLNKRAVDILLTEFINLHRF
jgi:hypothetical protein